MSTQPISSSKPTTNSSKDSSKERHLLLIPERIKFIKKSDSKKRVFDILSELLTSGQKNVSKNEIFDALIAREKLGNTVLGNGIAIPRASINITRPRAALVFLKKGIHLNSPDRKPTHLFLALLLPENECDKYTKMIQKINLTLAKQSIIEDISEHKNPQLLIDFFDTLFTTEKKNKQNKQKKVIS